MNTIYRIIITDVDGRTLNYPWMSEDDARAALDAVRKAKDDGTAVENINWLVIDGFDVRSAHIEKKEQRSMPRAALGHGRPAR